MGTASAWRRVCRSFAGLAAIGAYAAGTACAESVGGNRLVYGGVLGDVQQATSPNPGRVHVAGDVGAATADYFRGGFDGVQADLDELAIGPSLSVMSELWEPTPQPRSSHEQDADGSHQRHGERAQGQHFCAVWVRSDSGAVDGAAVFPGQPVRPERSAM